MATIDIRANVTCSLGPLISGSVSDDYLQGNGLVMTRGSCELTGLHTPAVGTEVTFAYSGPAGNSTVPRRLLVLSSFADPYRDITKVELGCKLTYLKDASPAPTVDGQAAVVSGEQQQCLNGWADYPAGSVVGYPISAAALMNTCLTKLGITASSSPLTNRFNRDTVDLGQGYVSILGDLLLSEGYVGYMDAAGTLQIRSLTGEGGAGPEVTSDSIVDLDAIGIGDLPGEAVLVRYSSTSLKGDIDTTATPELALKQWEEEETIGDPQLIEVRYQTVKEEEDETTGDPKPIEIRNYTVTAGFVPYSKTITKYGEDRSFDPTTCVLAGKEGADLSNSVLSRETEERSIIGAGAANYCTELLSAGIDVDITFTGTVRRTETYEYDADGTLTRLVSEVYEPYFKWLGGIDVNYVYYDAKGVPAAVNAYASPVLVERTVQDYEKIFDTNRRPMYLKAGESYEPPVLAEKITTTTYQNWTLTQQGQQGAAQIKESAPFSSLAEAEQWLSRTSQVLVMVDTQVRTNRTRATSGQARGPRELQLASNRKESETTAELIYSMGSASADRFKVFTMPFQSDDIYLASGAVSKGDAAAKALRFGRIQNRLLLGNRNGVNLQLHPTKMPSSPFDPIYLSKGGLTVQYRANGTSWAFSSEGVVASVDALYWGVAGGSGTAWVPVAPGVTGFPPQPIADGSGIIDVPSLVPPWVEKVPYVGLTRTIASITSVPYVVGSLGTTDIGAAVTRTKMQYSERLVADSRIFNVSGQDAGIKRIRGIAGEQAIFTVTGSAAGSLGFYVLKASDTAFSVAGKGSESLYQRAPMKLESGAFIVTGIDSGSFRGKGMELAGGMFNVNGQDSAGVRSYALSAALGEFHLSGEDVSTLFSDYFSEWTRQTYGVEDLFYPEWWAD